MPQNNSEINFTRSTKRNGLLSWPTIIFRLTRSDNGAEIGQLSIRKNEAAYTAANHRDDFRIRRSIWSRRWVHEGGEGRPFARTGFGFRPSISFADDARYYMRIRRRWRLRPKASDEYTHLATFLREQTLVMTLQNKERMPFFSSEVTAPMSGLITTDITEARVICGLLLLFQTTLMMRQAAAAGY